MGTYNVIAAAWSSTPNEENEGGENNPAQIINSIEHVVLLLLFDVTIKLNRGQFLQPTPSSDGGGHFLQFLRGKHFSEMLTVYNTEF